MMILLLLSAITTNSIRVPRCVAGQELNNKTIHLVHPYEKEEWQPIEFDIIRRVIENYQDFKIHLILINKEPSKRIPKYERNILNETEVTVIPKTTIGNILTSKSKTGFRNKDKFGKRKRRKVNDYHFNVNMEARKLLDILLNGKILEPNENFKSTNTIPAITTNEITENTSTKPVSSLEDLLKMYPDIIVENTTFNQVFFNSPLYPYWPEMNENIRIFAIRVLELWQYGGISFDLQPMLQNNGKNSLNLTDNHIEQIYNTKVMKFIITQKKKFYSLPDNVVAADDEGLHMESKIPCHAFFGEILMNLTKSHNYSSVQDILKSSIAVFCKHYAAEKRYCDNLQVKL